MTKRKPYSDLVNTSRKKRVTFLFNDYRRFLFTFFL